MQTLSGRKKRQKFKSLAIIPRQLLSYVTRSIVANLSSLYKRPIHMWEITCKVYENRYHGVLVLDVTCIIIEYGSS